MVSSYLGVPKGPEHLHGHIWTTMSSLASKIGITTHIVGRIWTMSEPFAGEYGKGGTFYGLTVVPPKEYNAVVKTINDLGWRATTHAVGDAALDQVLDAYEAANAEHPIAGRRWAIEHAFVSRPDQLARLKKLDVALSVQDHLYLA